MLKPRNVYKVVKGDEVDLLFSKALGKLEYDIAFMIKRISEGKYMFGTRNIIAKIINYRLVIRVGGGYMSVDEFIE